MARTWFWRNYGWGRPEGLELPPADDPDAAYRSVPHPPLLPAPARPLDGGLAQQAAVLVLLGVQLAFDLPAEHPLRRRLAGLQRACWQTATALLVEALPHAVLGTWDLVRDDATATYEEWASGLDGAVAGGRFRRRRQPAAGDGDRAGGQGEQRRPDPGDLCDIPERDWQRRATYRTLLGAPPRLNLTNVLGSGLYLAPRPDRPGFARAVLAGEGFEYLVAPQD